MKTSRILIASAIAAAAGVALYAAGDKCTTCDTCSTSVSSLSAKIVYIDMQKLMPQDPEGIKVAPQEWQSEILKLQKEITSRASKIQDKNQKLEKMVEEARKQSKIASQDSMEAKNIEMVQLQNNIQIEARALEEFQMKRGREVSGKFYEKIDKKVRELAVSRGWDIVIPVALYAKPSFDKTADVIAALDADHKKATVKPATPAPAAHA
ncbi:MAG: Outer membrane chaperone Skp (OmpH) [candidate division TM6 bacterium GW2011_GWE2_41_16]|nr:MAG: Outer membrane chaperone Skp (OmpH) [candidate division TM6 bacterium GW2011_GWE2_41_16]